jgi:prevent-host-death family protein
MVREVNAFEAKNKLGMLLDWVENGEEVVITRRGKAVARLVPTTTVHDSSKVLAAAKRIRSRAISLKQGAFDWQEWKAYRNESRL